MEMMQFLESDKEQILSGLVKAGSPEQAQTVLEKEFDKLLLQYNEECVEERVRNEARHMTQAAKMMIPMISSQGETRVWSKSTSSGEAGMKLTKTAIACIAGGVLFVIAAIASLAAAAGSSANASSMILSTRRVSLYLRTTSTLSLRRREAVDLKLMSSKCFMKKV